MLLASVSETVNGPDVEFDVPYVVPTYVYPEMVAGVNVWAVPVGLVDAPDVTIANVSLTFDLIFVLVEIVFPDLS